MSEKLQDESMSDNVTCAEARRVLGVNQPTYGTFTGKDKTVISKIENRKCRAIGPIVAISDLILRMTAPGVGQIHPEEIRAKLMQIPKARRTPWNTHNVLNLMCFAAGRQDLLEAVAGLNITIPEEDDEEAGDMDSMKLWAEDFKRRLQAWREQASPEARERLERAIEAAGSTEHWIEMALESEKLARSSKPKPPPGDPPDGGGG